MIAKIQIVGTTNTKKSTLAALVTKCLNEHGIKTILIDDDNNKKLNLSIGDLASRFDSEEITIETMQMNKNGEKI